jgi:hypothetical protein
MDAFAQAMFGHLGVIQVPCPTQAGAAHVCGETRRDYSSFIQAWDLYADWASQLPIEPPTPTSAWQRLSASYERAYRLGDRAFVVAYQDDFVLIGW